MNAIKTKLGSNGSILAFYFREFKIILSNKDKFNINVSCLPNKGIVIVDRKFK